MKIKTTKTMNLPKLIEWAMANDVRVRKFRSKNGYCVCFDRNGFIYFDNSRIIPLDQTFTVEVEEEITEDTEIEGLVEMGSGNHGATFFQCDVSSINEQKDFDSKAFYILNDDLTLTLIWTSEKGMVK